MGSPVTFSSPLQPIGNVIGTALNYKSDRAKQFNVMIEKEFAGNVITAGYIGARGDRLQQGVNYNLAPAGPGAVDPRRPYASLYPAMANATVLANVASSTYNAAQFVFNRRYKDGHADDPLHLGACQGDAPHALGLQFV